MEVCGGHTHSIYKHGVEDLLPPEVELVHGPGCPVCVIPMGRQDDAIALARRPEVIFTTFGDMMRVPASHGSLLDAKAHGADVIELRKTVDGAAIAACAAAIHDRLARGGRLLAFGNGGSATDAQDVAIDARAAGWPAVSLTEDSATITAVGNDVGFDNVFSRQIIALGRASDVALGFSTSGSSRNVVAALEESHRRGALTCAITGYDGGRIAALDWLDHLLVVPGDYVPRLQEAQATIYHLLLDLIGPRP